MSSWETAATRKRAAERSAAREAVAGVGDAVLRFSTPKDDLDEFVATLTAEEREAYRAKLKVPRGGERDE